MAKAPPERARKAKAEAHELLMALLALDLDEAADYIRDNPPSADAIAVLAFYGHDLLTSAQRSVYGSGPRKGRGFKQQLREAGCEDLSYAQVKEKHPKLVAGRSKNSVTKALSDIRRAKNYR